MSNTPAPLPRSSFQLLPGGQPAVKGDVALERGMLFGGAAFRILLAALVTHFVLVDDAYIHLRYARNFAGGGGFLYNAGEPVFGLTSPLYGLVASAMHFTLGPNVVPAMVIVGVLVWTLASHVATCDLSHRSRPLALALLTLSPVFVDNQLLGMESPLFALLLVVAVREAAHGRARTSAAAQGLALITRPEAVLVAPFLLLALASSRGWKSGVRDLIRPLTLALLFGPGLIWAAFSLGYYGHLLPQSMVAKSGWNSTHYDNLFGLEWALFTAPRLTFLPFLDYFPKGLQYGFSAALHLMVVIIGWFNYAHGSRASRAWFGFYVAYILFYFVGKGATEASWYAVPSSVALTLAAAPPHRALASRAHLPRRGPRDIGGPGRRLDACGQQARASVVLLCRGLRRLRGLPGDPRPRGQPRLDR